MPSLRDVAREVGVSVSLVSKVLNGRLGTTGARKELVDEIRATAERIGYRKNFNALSLLAKRQNAIAVFIHQHGAPGSGIVEKMLEGIAEAAGVSFQRLVLQFFTSAEEFREKSKELHGGMVDGLIVTGVAHPELLAELQSFAKKGVSVATIYNEPVHRSILNVGIPNDELSDAATTHLIERGCRRILHPSVLPSRTAGHRRALKRAKLSDPPELTVELDSPEGYTFAAGRRVTKELLDRGIKFDGVSAQSDTQAAGILNELVSRGIRVPDDVKIVGIDNAPFDEFTIVPLSSVSQRVRERGRSAVELLGRLIAGEKVASTTYAAEIRQRDSTL